MDIKEVIAVLILNNIVNDICSYEKLVDGTLSEVWLIESQDNKKIVAKMSNEQIIRCDGEFLSFYKEKKIFPNLLYIDLSEKLLCYEYIQGDINVNIDNMKLLKDIIDIVKGYKHYNVNGYGEINELSSYKNFFLNKTFESSKRIRTLIDYKDYMLVMDKINKIASDERDIEKYLLHGDFGIHNCVFKNKELVGVVDATPVVGEPIYDIIYALCSNIRFLSSVGVENIYSSLSELGYNKEIINAYLIVVLYIRVGTCIKYNTYDLQDYLKFWDSNFSIRLK